MEHASSIIQTTKAPKYKDSRCLIISIIIGATRIENSLLDLGTSVNLLPYSMYQQLGLGELKPTNITLQLVFKSTRVPRGMVEDVLIQVDKFYFLEDFIILDTQPISNTKLDSYHSRSTIPSNLIYIYQCRNGVMRLAFGNMT